MLRTWRADIAHVKCSEDAAPPPREDVARAPQTAEGYLLTRARAPKKQFGAPEQPARGPLVCIAKRASQAAPRGNSS